MRWNGWDEEITPEVESTVDFYVNGCLFRGYRPRQEIAREIELDLSEMFSPARMIELLPSSIRPLLLEEKATF